MANFDFLWSEEYRPHKIEDCILPPRLKAYFQDMVTRKQLQNMTLIGAPGTGKTTVAKAMCEEMGINHLLINASENGNIDTIRTDVRQFASAQSLMGGPKCIILDEADYLNANSAQPALRGAIEEFSKNCFFIFTGNFGNRIIEPLLSRAPVVDFAFTKAEKTKLIMDFDKRIKQILADKCVTYEKSDLAQLVVKNFPDFRKTINLLQRFSHGGKLEIGNSTGMDSDRLKELIGILKNKEFTNMRRWVVENMDNDGGMIRRAIYEKSAEVMAGASIPQLILHISTYDDKESRVMDKEINMVAFLTEVMSDCVFK